MTADLLRLLELAHPGKPQADLLAMIDATPDARPRKPTGKPVQRRVGSRPRTDASMERRRSWAAGGWMPPQIAARFTLAEMAVLSVVAQVSSQKTACELPLEQIAALAGVCRSTVKNALRHAQGLGFIRVEERRLSAWRNAPNRVTIVSPEWSAWLRMRSRKAFGDRTVSTAGNFQGGGVKSVPTTSTSLRKQAESQSVTNGSKGCRQAEGRVRWRETRGG